MDLSQCPFSFLYSQKGKRDYIFTITAKYDRMSGENIAYDKSRKNRLEKI